MTVTLVVAVKGEGKTSFLRTYVVNAASRGRSAGGVAAPAVFKGSERIGYDLLDLRTGHRQPLARVADSRRAAPTVGIYCLDENAIARGTAAIISAVRDNLDLIAIDEVGPLEFRGGGWASAVELALRECRSSQELIIAVRPALSGQLPERFPSSHWQNATQIAPPWPPLPAT